MAIGIFIGGGFIRIFKPGPRLLSFLVFFVELFIAGGMIAGLYLGCDGSAFFGYDENTQSLKLDTSCNQDCHCSKKVFQPLCSADGVTNYFSPCFAGCVGSETLNGSTVEFID